MLLANEDDDGGNVCDDDADETNRFKNLNFIKVVRCRDVSSRYGPVNHYRKNECAKQAQGIGDNSVSVDPSVNRIAHFSYAHNGKINEHDNIN